MQAMLRADIHAPRYLCLFLSLSLQLIGRETRGRLLTHVSISGSSDSIIEQGIIRAGWRNMKIDMRIKEKEYKDLGNNEF